MKNILITGGSGFIGTALAKRLINEGYVVSSFDRKRALGFPTVIGDITDREQVFKAIERMDYAYHFAAIANLNYARDHVIETIKVNVEGTYNIALACRKFNVPMVFASTLCVYGETPEHPSWSDSILVPTEIYALTKVVGENIIASLVPRHVILRFGTTYGPGMRNALAISVFIRQAMSNKPLTIDGSGEQTRQYIYIDDLIDALVKILNVDTFQHVFSVAGKQELSVNQVANMILAKMGKSLAMKKYGPDRPGQIMCEQVSMEKTEKILGWTAKTPFEEGLEKTIKWLKSKK